MADAARASTDTPPSPQAGPTVFLVDDDEAVRDSLSMLVRAAGLEVECFADPEAFLATFDPERHGCVVLDLRMPHRNGIEVFEAIRARGGPIPVLFLSAHGTVPLAVRAMRRGALDFLEKPVDHHTLLERIRRAVRHDREARGRYDDVGHLVRRHAALTEREREVFALVVEGHPNKIVADRLHVSPKTVEAHRARVMEKMGADSLAELVRMAMKLDLLGGAS